MESGIFIKLKSWLKSLSGHGGFLRSVLVLVSGTAFAHAITALTLPILTRLYTPADFATLAVFSSLLSIVSVAACMRFDVAISMPDDDAQAFNLFALAIGCAFAISIVAAACLFSAPSWVSDLMGRPDLQSYIGMLPFGIFLAGAYSALQNWFIRDKNFSLIARSRVTQSAASAGTQIGMGTIGSGPLGLILGYLLNTGCACLILGYRMMQHNRFRKNVQALTCSSLLLASRDYSRFPKYSTWEALANSAAIQLPVILIATYAVGSEAGYVLLAMSVIQAPMSLFGTAIGQVYLSLASQEYRDGRLASFTAEIAGGLIKTGIGPLLGVGIISPFIFESVFGIGWDRAGWLVSWMTPWFVMQFLATPVSMAIYVTAHQREMFILQVFGLLLRCASVLIASHFSSSYVSEAYALSGALFYSVYFWLALRCAKCSWKTVLESLKRSSTVIGIWVGLAVLVCMLWPFVFASKLGN